jgi:hypothetical protein
LEHFIEDNRRRIKLMLASFSQGIAEGDVLTTGSIDQVVRIILSIETMPIRVFSLAPFDQMESGMDSHNEPIHGGVFQGIVMCGAGVADEPMNHSNGDWHLPIWDLLPSF